MNVRGLSSSSVSPSPSPSPSPSVLLPSRRLLRRPSSHNVSNVSGLLSPISEDNENNNIPLL
jgi:hypothetical protein